MWHYIIAALLSAVLYYKWGAGVAGCLFVAFIAYKMYKAIKFLGKGKSETSLGPKGELMKWNFEGALFSFNADLETMTARFTAPRANTTIYDGYHTNNKYIEGPIDVQIPLRAISFYTHDETETIHTSYGATTFGYRTDGSYGQGYLPRVLTTSGKTGNVDFVLYTYKGSVKGSFVSGNENLAWSRDGSDWDKSYRPISSISRRQAESFAKGWSVVEAAIAD
jgi:hypothetical protein